MRRLNGAGRLRTTLEAKKPSEKPRSSKAKAESMKAAEVVNGWDDGGGAAAGGGWGAQDAKSGSKKSKSKKDEAEGGWGATAEAGWDNNAAKSESKKSKSKKGDGEEAWGRGAATGWDDNGADSKSKKSASKKSTSKKAASEKGEAWDTAAGGNAWGPMADTTNTAGGGGWDTKANDDKKSETKADDTWGPQVPAATAEIDPFANAATADDDEKKDDESSGWTAEQDKRLMELKTEDVKITWVKVAEEVGKTQDECKEHFKKIKPKDWKPNAAGGKGGGGDGGGGKKGKKNKGNDNNHNQGGDKKNQKKEEEKKKEEEADVGDLWGAIGGGDDDDKKDDTDKAKGWTETGNDGANDAKDEWGNKTGDAGTTGGGADAGDLWGGAATKGAAADTNWDSNKDQTNNTSGGFDPSSTTWPAATKPASVKATSAKAPSKAPSHKSSSPNTTKTRPQEYEVKPDKDFSADDLRLVARILQQDCGMVWNRVSWRFKDKTGRTMHPDVFEKKITGRVEGKGSEKGERRR
jgi:hypothetical protein